MASTVLGKRARAPESTNEPSSISSRVKRRACLPIVNDENADPDIAHNVQGIVRYGHCMELEELDDPFCKPSKSTKKISVLAKHSVVAGGVALSPSKINGHFKASKALPRTAGESKRIVQIATPQTPRHRDALSKRAPITPRHRVGIVGKPLTPHTPRTPLTPSNAPSLYNDARQLFMRSADPGPLVGREEERDELSAFIQKGIESKSGRCIYVSGPPGTGKSALVSEVCHSLRGTPNVQLSYVNCMSVKNSKDIYGKLMEDLIRDNDKPCDDEMAELREIFLHKNKSPDRVYVVTLDEIDHLLTLDLEILYTLFEWSLQLSSRLVLIGIANALDLTDRFLPRLKARNLKPQLLPFLPYTAPQIVSVITTKLKSLWPPDTAFQQENTPFLHPTAIQFCSKKVASQTGDLRKAFDIIRRTIDLIETETKQKHQNEFNAQSLQLSPSSKVPLQENPNLSSPSYPPAPAFSFSLLTPATAPRATIAHVARVSASALNHGTSQRLKTLNLQQKAALCALISIEKTNRRSRSHSIFATPSKSPSSGTAPTVRRLYETYCSLCKRDDALHPLTSTEFADVVGGLEMLGLVGDGDRKGSSTGTLGKKGGKGRGEERKMASWVGEKEFEGCLEGVGGAILNGLLRGYE